MPNVNRWALTNQQSAPNPGAGLTVGVAQGPRSEAEMKTPGAGPKDWHPTVLNLLILIVLELVAFSALRYFFRGAHGG